MRKAVIGSWNDMMDFGVIFLTGESCGFGMRCLCDVNQKGVDLLRSFFGGNINIKDGSNWNGSNEAVGSVMLPYGILPELAAYALLTVSKFEVVCLLAGGAAGYAKHEWAETGQKMKDMFPDRFGRTYSGGYASRNQHAMSGRVE